MCSPLIRWWTGVILCPLCALPGCVGCRDRGNGAQWIRGTEGEMKGAGVYFIFKERAWWQSRLGLWWLTFLQCSLCMMYDHMWCRWPTVTLLRRSTSARTGTLPLRALWELWHIYCCFFLFLFAWCILLPVCIALFNILQSVYTGLSFSSPQTFTENKTRWAADTTQRTCSKISF